MRVGRLSVFFRSRQRRRASVAFVLLTGLMLLSVSVGILATTTAATAEVEEEDGTVQHPFSPSATAATGLSEPKTVHAAPHERERDAEETQPNPKRQVRHAKKQKNKPPHTDCLSLVGPRTRTLGGVDQPMIRGRGNETLVLPSDGIVRSFGEQVDLSCRLFYHLQPASTGDADRREVSERDGPIDYRALEEGDEGAGGAAFWPFPQRYKPMDKQSFSLPQSSSGPFSSVRQSSGGGVGYFDVLFGLPETSHASPIRRHSHLYFHRAIAEDREHQRRVGEAEKEGSPSGGDDDERDDGRPTSLFSLQRALRGLKIRAFTALSRTGRSVVRYPFHRPSALERLFSIRTVQVSFPVLERRRRVYTEAYASEERETERAAGGGNEDKDEDKDEDESEEAFAEEFWASPASRAALLSEGSLSKLRILSFPPVPRRFQVVRAEGGKSKGASSSSASATGTLSGKVEERLVCDFKAVLQAAAHVREVERQMQERAEAEEARRRRRFRGADADDGGFGVDLEDGDVSSAETRMGGGRRNGGRSDGDAAPLAGVEEREMQRRIARRAREMSGQPNPRSLAFSFVSSLHDGGGGGGSRRKDDNEEDGRRRGVRGALHSFFPLYSWLGRKLMELLFPRLVAKGVLDSAAFADPPPSYYAAKDYVAQVTEELGPFQPSSFSFSSDYVRYVLGRRALYTSQRLLHVEESDAVTGAESDATSRFGRRKGVATLKVKELFVWRASLPSTETMCLGFTALPPLSTMEGRGLQEAAGGGAYALPIHLHEELRLDTLWLKVFVCLLFFHVCLKRHLEDSRLFRHVFASLCGLFALLILFIGYALKEMQKMTVGKMGIYVLLFFGGLTALLEGLVSVVTFTLQQLVDLLDARESGIGVIPLFTSSSSSYGHASDEEGPVEELLQENRRSALAILGVVLAVVVVVGAVCSFVVRCFVAERYLAMGTRVSLQLFLGFSWVLVFVINREATALSLLVYLLFLRPRTVLRWALWVSRGGWMGPGATAAAGGWNPDHRVSSYGANLRSYGETAYEPTDEIPEEARQTVSRCRPLTYEGNVGLGNGGMSHLEKMRKYDADGAEYTRRALDDLAEKLRSHPEKYTSRLRNPNSVQQWAGTMNGDEDETDSS